MKKHSKIVNLTAYRKNKKANPGSSYYSDKYLTGEEIDRLLSVLEAEDKKVEESKEFKTAALVTLLVIGAVSIVVLAVVSTLQF